MRATRSYGLLFAAVAVIVAVLWRDSPTVPLVARATAAILAAVRLVAPVFLKPINLLWFQFGLLTHRVVNPIVMFAVYAAVLVPAGAIMRLWCDPLRSRPTTWPRPIGSSAGNVKTLTDPWRTNSEGSFA